MLDVTKIRHVIRRKNGHLKSFYPVDDEPVGTGLAPKKQDVLWPDVACAWHP